MKTPEQMAEEWATEATRQYIEPYDTWSAEEYAHVYYGFLAGYQAAKDQLQPQPFHAGADVYIIDANNPLPKPMPLSIAEQVQFADADKVTPKWNSVDAVGDSIDRSAIQHALAVLKKKPSPQWIHINERWPNFDELVLVYIPSAAEWQRIRTTVRLQPDGPHNGLIPRFSTVPLGAVTHWMPLPEPPEGKE